MRLCAYLCVCAHTLGWGYSYLIEYLPGIDKTQGWVPTTTSPGYWGDLKTFLDSLFWYWLVCLGLFWYLLAMQWLGKALVLFALQNGDGDYTSLRHKCFEN